MKIGIGASPGIGIGKVLLLEEPELQIDSSKIEAGAVPKEVEAFKQAVEKSSAQLQVILDQAKQNQDKETMEIMEAHVVMLYDPVLEEEVKDKIEKEQVMAPYAVKTIIEDKVKMFEAIDDDYLRERAKDIQDIGNRILRNLLHIADRNLSKLEQDTVLVGKDITPSQMAMLDRAHVKGIVTEEGGKTSHTAIMARNMDIPAVLGAKDALTLLQEDEVIVVDGNQGVVEQNLSKAQLQEYAEIMKKQQAEKEALLTLKDQKSVTTDGHHVELAANIGKPEDTKSAMANGAEGVGLFRTEFLLMDRKTMPSEEEQYEAYYQAVVGMEKRPIIIRTFDIGGDKEVPFLNLPKEENPFLGYRAIRICLDDQKLFKTQLRAILRASAHGPILIMYPMIASVQEVRQANAILEQVKGDLRAEGIAFDEEIKVGIMVEIPSAAMSADLIVKEVDFFSIGTNDLTQYTLAVDRMNQKISHLYNSFDPAVLRLIKRVIDVSHAAGKFTGMCGEFAGNPAAALMLLGLGLDEFSMSPSSILKIRKMVTSISKEKAEAIAGYAMQLDDPAEIESYLNKMLAEVIE